MARRLWPFVSLTSERRLVLDAASSDFHPPGFVVLGPPGLGKTALARHWLSAAQGPALWIVATEASRQVPFGVFADVIDDPSHQPLTELRAARRAVERAGSSLRIVVDDAHLLDGTSAMFVQHVVEEGLATVFATVRSGAPVPDAVRALWKDHLLVRVDLHGFSLRDCAEVCSHALGGPVAPDSVARLHAASEGSPLYLRHLVEGSLERGILHFDRGMWRLDGATVLGPDLADTLGQEWAALSPALRDVASLVAFGEPLRIDDLSTIVGGDVIEAAEDAGVIEVTSDGHGLSLRMAHPLMGDHVRGRTGALRARRLRGQLFEAAWVRSRGIPDDAVRLAMLALDSDREPPLALLTTAAERALTRSDLAAGEVLARAALERGAGFDAVLILAHALSWQGKGHETEAILENAVPEDEEQLARWGVPRVANRFWTLGDVDGARSALDQLTSAVTDERALATFRAMESAIALSLGELDRSIELAAEVLARPDVPPSAAVWASGTLSIGFSLLGRGDDVPGLIERTASISVGFDSGFVGHATVLGLVFAGTLTGTLEEAERRIAARSLEADSVPNARAFSSLAVGSLLLARGRADEAEEQLATAALLLGDNDATGWGMLANLSEAEAAAQAGHLPTAERALATALARSHRIHTLFAPRTELTRAHLAASKGETSVAMALARRAARLAASGKQFALSAVALHTALRFGDTSLAGQLAELAARCDGDLPLAMASHADGVSRRDAALVATASERFEELGFGLLAIDAAIDAAEEFGRAGDAAGEFTMRTRVRRLEIALGPVDTPALRRHRRPLPLTAREREIATLVGDGLSNRAIAERLTVSVRTVEGHVYHVCIKLGLPNKQALAAARIDGEGDHVPDYA
jgi:DNA-binding CsgD family transcriptional regulator